MSAARFEIRVALGGGDFTLDVDVRSDARCLGLFGPSGAGKTSVLEVVAGWRAADRARVEVAGHRLVDDELRLDLALDRRGVGYVPQDVLLLPHWSVARNVRAASPDRRGVESDDLVRRIVETLEIDHLLARNCAQLSGGERQRVALARALVSRPRVLLLDEPLGSLDLALRRRILPYLMRVRDAFEVPIVFVSHDQVEAQALCDEIVVLERGRVVDQGDPSLVLRRHSHGQRCENVVGGRVRSLQDGVAQVVLTGGDEVSLPAAGLAPGSRVLFSIGADEILMALDRPSRISARNVLCGVVEESRAVEGDDMVVDARLPGGGTLSVLLTTASFADLEVRRGKPVVLLFKTNSCRVLSVADPA